MSSQRGGEERVEAEGHVSRNKISSTHLEMKGMGCVADEVIGVLRGLREPIVLKLGKQKNLTM